MDCPVDKCSSCPLCLVENTTAYCEHPKWLKENGSRTIAENLKINDDIFDLDGTEEDQFVAPEWCPLKRESLTLYFKPIIKQL